MRIKQHKGKRKKSKGKRQKAKGKNNEKSSHEIKNQKVGSCFFIFAFCLLPFAF
ncbi:MAG: hypothetical protein MOB07_22960 [Acidobacteria bacterium]|nr:hypothetical protein [Acidobacteriota bacterium]